MEQWPELLPLADNNNALTDTFQVVRAPKQRSNPGYVQPVQRFRQSQQSTSLRFTFRDIHLLVFTAFVKHGLFGGVKWFLLPAFFGGAKEDYIVRIVNGSYSCDSLDYDRWRVTFNVDIYQEEETS